MLLVPKAPAAVPFPQSTLSVAGTVGVRFGLEVLCWLIASMSYHMSALYTCSECL